MRGPTQAPALPPHNTFHHLTARSLVLALLARHTSARGSEVDKRLLEALSGDNWGASSSLLNQIANDTYDL